MASIYNGLTVPLSILGDYNITVFQSELVSDNSFCDYNLAWFPQTANVGLNSSIGGTDEAVRNCENTAFVF